MNKKIGYRNILLLAVLIVGVAACGALFHWDNKYTSALPGGYGYNILNEDPDEIGFLVDGWEYYPGQLLEPEEFQEGVSPEEYTFPGQYSNFSSHLGTPYGVATYRLLLYGENGGGEIALYLPELLCAGKIYINGTLLGEQGSIEPYIPLVMDGLYTVQVDGVAEIVIQCANFTHYYSGLYYPPAVGSTTAIFRMLVIRFGVYGVLCFSSLAVALMYFVQWLGSKDRSTRWMGLLSLAFGLRESYPFLRAIGIPWVRPLYGLEDVAGTAVLLFAILLAGERAGVAKRPYHRRVAIPAAVALCAVTLVFPLWILPYVPFFINPYGLLLWVWKIAAGIYLLVLAGHSFRTDTFLGCCLAGAAGFYGLSVVATVMLANRFEPAFGAWFEEYGGYALVIGFAGMMVRRGILLSRENQHLTLHLQEEVERKTQGMNALLTERRELLGNLLHDVKNPLTALRGYAELVRSGNVAMDQETSQYLHALIERVDALGDRFSLLQSFSRSERGVIAMEKMCLNDFLREFHMSNQPDMELQGLEFRLELPWEKLSIRGNEDRLRIALENLCYNALSFTPEEGVVVLELKRKENWALISVKDTGQGIPEENMSRVFDRGFTYREDNSGEGLGLYIVRSVAVEHGGVVEVSSQLGQGSQFTIRLPLLFGEE